MSTNVDDDNMPTIDKSRVSVLSPKDQIEGVNQKAAGIMEKMLKDGRRYFGSSGSVLTHQINDTSMQHENFDKEKSKELLTHVRKTTDFLREWMQDKPNVALIDSVRTHGWGDYTYSEDTGGIVGGYVDHVLIFGTEVVILNTKDFGKKKNFLVDEDGDIILKSGKPVPGGENMMDRTVQNWLNYLEPGAALTGIIYLTGEENSIFRNRNWFMQSFRVAEEDRFRDLLNEKWKSVADGDRHNIDPALITQAVVNCVKPFDEFSRVLTDKAIQEFKK